MTSVDETHSPSGGHPTPEQRQAPGPPVRFVKLNQAALEDVAESHNLRRAQADLLGKLIEALSEEWRYEPRIVQARSRNELWELLKHNARRSLPALLEAGLVAEHRGTGFEVLCWDQVVDDTARELAERRKWATKHLAAGDRWAATVEALYAASQVYELPDSGVNNVHTTVNNVHATVNNVHSRPAVSRTVELLELQELPPLPPLDSHQEPAEVAGVGKESVPDTPAVVLNLEDKRAARSDDQVRIRLADLEAAADEAAGNHHYSPVGWLKVKIRELTADQDKTAEIHAYREQYPDLEDAELAERIWADRSPGPRLSPRDSVLAALERMEIPPTAEDQSAEGYAARVARHGTYAPELAEVLEVLDLPREG